MYYILYKITNTINGKIYIGVHRTQNIDDGYMGSGTLLKRAKEKYGTENFEKEIIATFDNIDDMFNAESNIVNEDFINRDDTYNITIGGYGGFYHINDGSDLHKLNATKGGYASNFTKARTRWRNLYENDSEWWDQQNISRSSTLKERYRNTPGTFKNKKHTDDTKQKIGKANSKHQTGKGNSQYGKMWIHNLELKESKRIPKDDSVPEGWLKGRKIKF